MQTKTGIIFLQRDKFQIYSPYLPNILEFRFVSELIRDFDLISYDLLENLLKVFIANNKISTSGLVIVIAENASFIKDFVLPQTSANNSLQQSQTPPPTLEDLQNQANEYLEHVPFEEIASKTFPLASGVRAFATNQEIYEGMKTILEKQGFIIQGVFPGFAFGQDISNKPYLDGPSIGLILQKLPTLREYNLLKETPVLSETTLPEEKEEKDEAVSTGPMQDGEKNKKMILAVGISAIVLIFIITGGILYYQFANPPYKPPPTPVAQQPTVAPPQVSQVVPSIAPVSELTVQITSASQSAVQAGTVKTAFTKYGFKTVTTQNQDTLGTGQGLLIFSSRVDSQTKTSITEDVKNILGDVLIQEKADASFDIVVILGK